MITKELQAAFAEILKTEVDFKLEPVVIQLTPELAEKMNITAEMLEVLDGFVEFVEV